MQDTNSSTRLESPQCLHRCATRSEGDSGIEAFETILSALQSHVRTQGEKVAYTFLKSDQERQRITYRQLDDRARTIAQELLRFAEPGDTALMTYPPGLEFIEAFLGCLYAGIVAVPAYPPKKNRNAERVLAIALDCQPRLLLCAAETQGNLEGEFAAAIAGAEVLATDEIGTQSGTGLPVITPDQLAFLQYTSGSTAAPKGVMVSHRNISANEQLIQNYFDFSQAAVMISWLPMFHDMGLIGGILAPLFVGFPSVLMAPTTFLRDPVVWLKAVTEYRGTVTGAPNFAYDLCVRKITSAQKQPLDLSSLKIAYNGAEPVRADTLERFSDAFAECGFRKNACFPCYGLAETTLLASGGPPLVTTTILSVDPDALEQHKIVDVPDGQRIVSCGQVGPNLVVRIVQPETGVECDANEVGEVWVHGASVAQGYLHRLEETDATFRAKLVGDERHWLRTGDYGFVRDNELYITGRLKDLIIIRGRNIYPQDIESCVLGCMGFDTPISAAAFQVSIDGQCSLAVVIEATRAMYQLSTRQEGDPSGDVMADSEAFRSMMWRLKQVVNQQFDVVLSHIAFVKPGDFPRTSSGKLMRSRCQRDFLLGQAEYLSLPMASRGPNVGEDA